jgi:hypothetical protein
MLAIALWQVPEGRLVLAETEWGLSSILRSDEEIYFDRK